MKTIAGFGIAALVLGSCCTAGAAEKELYEGFAADCALLHKQVIYRGAEGAPDTRASSAEACLAAQRIFSRAAFLFRTRAEVLEWLGDPAVVSDYNEPAGDGPSDPLVYTFDSGFGGNCYTLEFDRAGRVNAVRVESLN